VFECTVGPLSKVVDLSDRGFPLALLDFAARYNLLRPNCNKS